MTQRSNYEALPDDSGSEPTKKTITPADIRYSAMNLLARREHSQTELLQKLGKRFPDNNQVEHEVQRLTDENLQSDERFAESFLRQRAGRGYGSIRIRQELKMRGVAPQLIVDTFEQAEIDWWTLASDTYQKKFGAREIEDIRDKAKRVRFMQYRGFQPSDYQHLF